MEDDCLTLRQMATFVTLDGLECEVELPPGTCSFYVGRPIFRLHDKLGASPRMSAVEGLRTYRLESDPKRDGDVVRMRYIETQELENKNPQPTDQVD